MARKAKDPIARYLEKIADEPTDGCWLWTGKSKRHAGHGQFYWTEDGERRQGPAHKFLYEQVLTKVDPERWPPLKAGEGVLHACDVAECQTPGHLRAGSQKENMADAVRNGRIRVKIDSELAGRIKLARASGASYADIARWFGISKSSAWRAANDQVHPERLAA